MQGASCNCRRLFGANKRACEEFIFYFVVRKRAAAAAAAAHWAMMQGTSELGIPGKLSASREVQRRIYSCLVATRPGHTWKREGS